MITLDQFVAKYRNQKGIGTNPSDLGECGGAYNKGTEEMWDLRYPIRDVLNMGDLLQGRNTRPDLVEIILNNPKDPNQIPQKGDAIVFMPSPTGDKRGHVGWVVAAGLKQVSIFDQSQGIVCAVRNYDYINVKGWIRFKGGIMSKDSTITKVFNMGLDREPDSGAFSTYRAVTDEVLVNSVYDSVERKQVLADRALKDKTISDLQTALQNEKNRPPEVVIQTVEKIVDRVVEKPVDEKLVVTNWFKKLWNKLF